ncbi:recombinase family protein [Tropicimonas sediminicola]|uniref:Recombinase n=1 Tax=Tropicimonas sediminicola TaxID=1031541 RepID=A0A239FRX7_9RHOB|nr:recombinase family protein [Tropicimonas sediminicola]SNS59806.1 Recombinase [Tropicimonas sediminicola]
MQNAVGFYWTLPVPWAGFERLPDNVEEAAVASRTIRYQRERIRRFAKDETYRLVAEEIFMEIAPDRASAYVRAPLAQVAKICRAQDATLLFVDFSQAQGWRSHAPFTDWARRLGIRVTPVYPDEVLIDGKPFDPAAHFSQWRERQDEWTRGKGERVARALQEAQRLRAEKRSNREIAEELNARQVQSATGKPWKEDSVRKLLGPAKAPKAG